MRRTDIARLTEPAFDAARGRRVPAGAVGRRLAVRRDAAAFRAAAFLVRAVAGRADARFFGLARLPAGLARRLAPRLPPRPACAPRLGPFDLMVDPFANLDSFAISIVLSAAYRK